MTNALCRNGCPDPRTCKHVRAAWALATEVRDETEREEEIKPLDGDSFDDAAWANDHLVC